MSAVQEICDRTALTTGKGLGELIHAVLPTDSRGRGRLLALLMLANVLNMAADLVAIGQGMHLLHAGSATLWAVIAGGAITTLVVSGSFATIANVFKFLCLSLIAYVIVLAVSKVDWGEVLTHLLIPHITWSAAYFGLLIGVLGTTISPYLFFWQSAHRIEEPRRGARGRGEGRHARRTISARSADQAQDEPSRCALRHDPVERRDVRDHRRNRRDPRRRGRHDDPVGRRRSKGTRARRRQSPTTIFALGFIGAGFLAVPVLAGSGSSAMAGLLDKRWGFSRFPRKAPLFYGLVVIATITATALSLWQVNPISLLVVVAVINGVLAAPFVAIVMLIASDERIMGDHRNGGLAQTLGWLTFALMAAAAVALLAIQLAGG